MAVPSAVTRRKEADASVLRAQGIDPDSGAPLAVQVSDPASAPSTQPTHHFTQPTPQPSQSTDESAALRAKITELEQQLATQNGRTSASSTELEEAQRRLALLDRNREFLDGTVQSQAQRVQELEREIEELRNKTAAGGVSKVISDLEGAGIITPEELKEFGPDTVAFVQKTVKIQLASALKPIVDQLAAMSSSLGKVKDIDKLPQLERTVQAAAQEATRNRESEFFRREVLAYFPDFPDVVKTPEWQAYIHSDVPGRGIKVGQLLRAYQEANNVAGIRATMTTFYDKRTSKPTLASLAVPAKSTADAPEPSAPTKMKSSEYTANLRAMTMKKLPKPEWEAFKAKWDAALSAGNVEFDVPVA